MDPNRQPSDTARAYAAFLARKSQVRSDGGFDPLWLSDALFDFQRELVVWALRRGRAAIFADCGLGKTLMQLVWAENVVRYTNGRVLILTPLAVGQQTLKEGEKFGIACHRSREGVIGPTHRIVISNYEQLHHFAPQDFAGVVCDESSILKHFSGATQKAVTRFMAKIPYRLLCTATAAPNDYIELGTSSEALGELGYSDMLTRFFRQTEKKPSRMEDVAHGKRAEHYAKLAFRISQTLGQWRLKGHAEIPFWQWVASWARACRMPSDLGFENNGFLLPPLEERWHTIIARRPPDGLLFTLPAIGLWEEREERRRTMTERCEQMAHLAAHADSAILWCHLNAESRRLAECLPEAIEVTGSQSDEEKEERIAAFLTGQARALITKPKIAGLGLNLQHCAHVLTFVSHSYESYYQSIRRCWRFGQTRPVRVDILSTEGEIRVRENMIRKAHLASVMFDRIVRYMSEAVTVTASSRFQAPVEVPTWISPHR